MSNQISNYVCEDVMVLHSSNKIIVYIGQPMSLRTKYGICVLYTYVDGCRCCKKT